tara:strand:- start:606 stop:1712 length:1107 start_codon:yes stop_codon:yes gene_type:complete
MYKDLWEEIDYFLYYDYWHREGHEKSKEIREKNIEILSKLLDDNLEIYLAKKTLFNILNNREYDFSNDAEYFVCNDQNYEKFTEIIEQSDFEIILQNKKQITLLRNNRLIVVNFKSTPLFSRYLYFQLFNHEFKAFRVTIIYLKLINTLYFITIKLRNKYKLFKQKKIKDRNTQILLNNLKLDNYIVGSLHQINFETFLNLQIESKESPSWLIRKKHLDLVTNNKKYIKISEIIDYLKRNNKLHELMAKVTESKIDKPIEGSISHSKKFWYTGNNYFIYAINYQFRKNVVPYKKINKFLKMNKDITLYSKEYYESLDTMDDDEIKDFLDRNPIEITSNYITSGKHRIFAMIGRIIDGKDYIPMTAKLG